MKALRLIAWFLIFGLLPFWASLVIVISGSNGRSDYWAAAPWLVVLSIPFCAITLVMAGVTYGVYVATDGGWSRKIKYAGGCFAALSALVLVGVAIVWNRHQAKEADIKANEEAGRLLVERSPFIASTAPPGYRVSLSGSQFNADGSPSRFTYFVRSLDSSSGALLAIVEVSRSSSGPRFRLTCVIDEREYHKRQGGTDPCQSSHATASP